MDATSQRHATRVGILLVSLAAMLWGTVGIATQAIYRQSELTAVGVGFYRLACAFPLVALLCWKVVDWPTFRAGLRHSGKMALIGIMLAIYQVCYFASISQVGVTIATLITLCTAPVLVALASAVLLREPLTRSTLTALFAALFGTALLVGLPATPAATGQVALGAALALGSAAGYAIVALLGRALAHSCHPLHSTAVSFGVGAIFLLPIAMTNLASVTYTPEIWGLVLYTGLLPTAVAYTLFFLGMRSIKASSASILTMLEPLTATALAWLIFDEQLAATGIAGALLLLFAIIILYRGEAG